MVLTHAFAKYWQQTTAIA